ncbi:hypothetical protein SAMN05421858_3355 [Haladaptatus litoreus]|uniref:Uncharacterized protein n=1 Tax=Haladaptatus litoreus TaxID=553468 RepID=A0A1N7CZB1_9EURY|nr:hypothetical protein SAMN05421858_3355 [Haladaptatus litoreus]
MVWSPVLVQGHDTKILGHHGNVEKDFLPSVSKS